MANKKESAVQFLLESLMINGMIRADGEQVVEGLLKKIYTSARRIEKDQIMSTFDYAQISPLSAEEYYDNNFETKYDNL
jgi:hypothetical protein